DQLFFRSFDGSIYGQLALSQIKNFQFTRNEGGGVSDVGIKIGVGPVIGWGGIAWIGNENPFSRTKATEVKWQTEPLQSAVLKSLESASIGYDYSLGDVKVKSAKHHKFSTGDIQLEEIEIATDPFEINKKLDASADNVGADYLTIGPSKYTIRNFFPNQSDLMVGKFFKGYDLLIYDDMVLSGSGCGNFIFVKSGKPIVVHAACGNRGDD
ncbi:MAG: hypothetical protein ACXWQE_13395, partial [Bdellovibrionales bacterium]